jgi:hypothetical protein
MKKLENNLLGNNTVTRKSFMTVVLNVKRDTYD